MSDQQRLDAFFERLKADPELGAIAVLLTPYRVMMRDPQAMVATLDALSDHWAASALMQESQK